MKLIEIAAAVLGLNASLGLAVKLHYDQKPGIYVGDHRDEHGLNHTRIGDISAASRILRGLRSSSPEGRRTPTPTLEVEPTRVMKRLTPTETFGETFHCWEGGGLESSTVLNLRANLGQQCSNHPGNWVHPYSTVYATDGELAVFFCDYGKQATFCTAGGLLESGQELDRHCDYGPGEDYTRVEKGPNWSYGVTFADRHFCTGESGGWLTQQQGEIGDDD